MVWCLSVCALQAGKDRSGFRHKGDARLIGSAVIVYEAVSMKRYGVRPFVRPSVHQQTRCYRFAAVSPWRQEISIDCCRDLFYTALYENSGISVNRQVVLSFGTVSRKHEISHIFCFFTTERLLHRIITRTACADRKKNESIFKPLFPALLTLVCVNVHILLYVGNRKQQQQHM